MRNISEVGLLFPQKLTRTIQNLPSTSIHKGDDRIKNILLVVAKRIHFAALAFGEKPGGRFCGDRFQFNQWSRQFSEERIMCSAGIVRSQLNCQLLDFIKQIPSQQLGIGSSGRFLKVVVVKFFDLLDLRRSVICLRFKGDIVITVNIL